VKNIRQLFDRDNPADSFVITDDFVSSGSGAKSIPIFRLKIGSFHMSGGQAVAGELISRAVSANWLTFSASFNEGALVLEPFYLEREFGL
jgi:hypothetical protein